MTTIRIHGQSGGKVEKIQAIRTIREVTNLGLREANELVEYLPNTFTIPSDMDAQSIVHRLRGYGYNVDIGSSSNPNNTNIEQAFKNFLIALINDGEYDQAITFIKIKKHGSVAGAPTRNLEPM
jgi:hypothetical protein